MNHKDVLETLVFRKQHSGLVQKHVVAKLALRLSSLTNKLHLVGQALLWIYSISYILMKSVKVTYCTVQYSATGLEMLFLDLFRLVTEKRAHNETICLIITMSIILMSYDSYQSSAVKYLIGFLRGIYSKQKCRMLQSLISNIHIIMPSLYRLI